MRRIRFPAARWWLLALAVSLVVAAAVAGPPIYRTAATGAGFKAKILCSGVFVSRRDAASVLDEDLGGERYRLLGFFRHRVEAEAGRVTVSLFGLAGRTAIHRDGLGCTLVLGTTEAALRAQAPAFASWPEPPDAPWPEGERVAPRPDPDVDAEALAAAVDSAFREPETGPLARTRALVVVHRGRIVAERYAPGFGPQTALVGWSMTKTATAALVGVLARDGRLALDDTGLRPEWRAPGDARAAISVDHLLRMSSGLAFSENYADVLDDVTQMLFARGDKAAFAADKPLDRPPGEHWSYSSGTSILLAAVLRDRLGSVREALAFPRTALFEPLGMRTAVFEADASGTLIGSSLLYASARDWARLGLLYLRDGVWNGRRLLPEGWVAYTTAPAPAAPGGIHGAHVWLGLPEAAGPNGARLPGDAFFMLGHDQQVVAVVPSRDLAVVRLGLTRERGGWRHGPRLAPLIAAFPVVE